jgi:protein RecA
MTKMKKGGGSRKAPTLDLIDFGAATKALEKEGALGVLRGVDMRSPTVLPTGLPLLDLAWNGGLPAGCITHLWGDSATGKTMLGLYFAARIQQSDPRAVVFYFDVERALSSPFATLMGLDLSRVMFIMPDTVEAAFQGMEAAIVAIRKQYQDVPLLVVWDSLAATVPQAEFNGEYDNKQPGRLAASISQGIKKFRPTVWEHQAYCLILNQCRTNIGIQFGEKLKPCGGKAAFFNADISARLRLKERLKVSKDADPYGIRVTMVTDKNRLGLPYRKAEFDFIFATGEVTDRYAILAALKTYKLATVKGGSTVLWDGSTYSSGEVFCEALKDDPRLTEQVLERLKLAYHPIPGQAIESGGDSGVEEEEW